MELISCSQFSTGQLIENRYQVEKVLGEGASGIVLLAFDKQLGNQAIALKFLHSQLLFSNDSYGRFLNETRVTMSLNHPHILQTYGLGQHDSQNIYLKMEFLEGESLEEKLLSAGAYSIDDAVVILRDIAAALEYAHRTGVIHRDLKPANILLNTEGRPKIADFGLAQMIRLEARYTGYGDILGTPYYMSPEQLRSEAVDYRSDIYSFGILAFELLTNKKPFDADSFLELAEKHFSEPLPTFDSPTWLVNLIERCTEKDRLDRFASMAEVFEILDANCEVGALSKKSSQSRHSPTTLNSSEQVALKTKYRIFGLTFHRERFLGFGYIRLKLILAPFIIALLIPHVSRPVRWRYATAVLGVEKFVDFEIPPLRLLFNIPLDLRYPDSFFIDYTSKHDIIKLYLRPLLFLGYDSNIINPETKTYPLHSLAGLGRNYMTTRFIYYGANPNLVDGKGLTALGHGVRAHNLDANLLTSLIDNGANPNITSPLATPPLAYLLSIGKIHLAKLLITRGGASVEIPSQLELPILHLAVQTHDVELVALLLKKGISTKLRDSQGKTALELAEEFRSLPGAEEIIGLLEEQN